METDFERDTGERRLRGPDRGLVCAAILCALGTSATPVQAQAGGLDRTNTYTASPFTGLHEPIVEALLFNPPVDEFLWKELDNPESTKKIEPSLVVSGQGLPDGTYRLTYKIESGEAPLYSGAGEVSVAHGRFERVETLSRKYPGATRVSYELVGEKGTAVRGASALRFSRFRGQVRYLDGGWRSTYVELHPDGFASRTLFYVPIGDDGRFDAWLPARVYPVVSVDGAGYAHDAMERWAWDFDLTRDREEVFTIGRTELYGIHAFNILGGPRTVFVAFRPTALSRLLRFDVDGDGRVSDVERKAQMAAMRLSPTAIGPQLQATDVTVWMNGVPQKIEQFNQVPEYDGDFWQVQYLLQFSPELPVANGVSYEIKLEVRSEETLRGKAIVDFGQGSVGFWPR